MILVGVAAVRSGNAVTIRICSKKRFYPERESKGGRNAIILRLQLEKIILEGISLEFNKSLSPKEKKH